MNKNLMYRSKTIDELFSGLSSKDYETTKKRMLLAICIDDAIKAKGWRKKDLAEAMGKSPSEITKWLSGTHNFETDTLFDIERVLGISLFNLENHPRETTITYVVNLAFTSPSIYPNQDVESLFFGKSSKAIYSAKSELNSINSN